MNINLSIISDKDHQFMREMFYAALYNPDPLHPYPPSIIDSPELSHYIQHWGQPGDAGFIAMVKEVKAGTVWIRLFSRDNPGYGFIDASIPELSMAVKSEFRNKGIGGRLLETMLEEAENAGHASVSLSVDQANQALHLYERFGFKVYRELETSYTMLKKF